MPLISPLLRRLSLLALVLLALTPFAAPAATLEPLTIVTKTGRYPFNVEMAATPEARSRGLMFRKSLAADYGMLFDFEAEQEQAFWMKNTYVSLDMIFIRADGTVHRIAENTTPLSLDTVPSDGKVLAVLEVVAGTARRLGLAPGDRIEHRLFAKPRG